jgi:hypothetical protein
MNFFAGMSAGFGKGQGEYNAKMLDLINEKNRNLATMYGHLADQSQDQDIASELVDRAQRWASANPLLDPKGYKELVKADKGGLHEIVDRAHQKKISDYHQSSFGATPQSQPQTQPDPMPGLPGQPPTQMTQPPTMDQFVRGTLSQEPPMYGSIGRYNPEWQQWHEIYTKKMEGTVPTPQGMQGLNWCPFHAICVCFPFCEL